MDLNSLKNIENPSHVDDKFSSSTFSTPRSFTTNENFADNNRDKAVSRCEDDGITGGRTSVLKSEKNRNDNVSPRSSTGCNHNGENNDLIEDELTNRDHFGGVSNESGICSSDGMDKFPVTAENEICAGVEFDFSGKADNCVFNVMQSPEEKSRQMDDCCMGNNDAANESCCVKDDENRNDRVRSLRDAISNLDAEAGRCLAKSKKNTTKPVSQDVKEIKTLTFETYEVRTVGTENICKKIESAYLLKHLNISNCDLNKISQIGDLFRTIFERYCLQTLNLSNNNLPDKKSEFIAQGIQETTSLQELNISKNRFGDKAAQCIGAAMGKNESITKLNMSWNEIRGHASVVFIKSIMRNKTIVSLDVSWNGFGYEGALATSEFLKKNKTLKQLDLTNNRIDWKAAALIADGLAKNQTLQRLELGENPLTTNGCMDIIDAIDSNKNTQLVYLGLKKVPVIADFQVAVDYIKNEKEFDVQHGGIVGTHDVVGYKPESRVTAIEKVIDFINEKKLRKTEFFRQLDINTEGNLNPEKLRERLKKTNVGLPDHEINELIAFLMDDNNGNANIDFKKISVGVKDSKDKQRLEKINVVEEKEKTKKLHEKLLAI